jgi:hypothetical protein
MRALYRIVDRSGGPIFEGKRSRVLEKLATRELRDRLSDLRVEICIFNPALRIPKTWRDVGGAAEFTLGQQLATNWAESISTLGRKEVSWRLATVCTLWRNWGCPITL